MIRRLAEPRWLGIGCVGLSLLVGACMVVAQDHKRKETPGQIAQELGRVVDQLNALAVQFDVNKNRSLSPDEQERMLKFVEDKHGRAWAERVRWFLKGADTNGDETIDEEQWRSAIQKLQEGQSSRPTPKHSASPPRDRTTHMVAMRDGIKLATDVYLPRGDGPFPAVLVRTPYGKTSRGLPAAGSFVARGVAVVVQDMRGRFDSQGENLPFIEGGEGQHHDGHDTIAWIRRQSWSNGKVGTVGGSAAGIAQNLLAPTAPEGLKAQHIAVAPASIYHHAAYVGGALRQSQVENWTRRNNFDPKAEELYRAHPEFDGFWRSSDTRLQASAINVPAVHVGGWFDTFAQGTIDSSVARQHQGGPGARGKQKLVMGPWTHPVGRSPVGELTFPDFAMPEEYTAPRWFDYHLKDVDNGVMDEPAVAYYVLGDVSDPNAPGNVWRRAADWPIPARETPFYLRTPGGLAGSKPEASEALAEYTFDPADPCPTIGGNNLTIPAGPRNQNLLEKRKDVVLFTSEPLKQPLEVTGRVAARIFVSSSAVDTDLPVRLCDVYPDGKSYNIAEAMLRLRYRKSFEKPQPLTPGAIVEAAVDCWSTSIIFNRGHRLRVTVTSSNSPRFDVNSGTGKPYREGDRSVKQTNRIYCDAAHPSCIVLPVVENPAG
jgi:predicted acyl esterase